ncbi:hypothetical protein K469DRAFT_497468, partial [Zopfia rhizophila CBS 207.26]
FRWCPRADCSSGQIHDTGRDGPIFTCVKCRTKLCLFHETAWHEAETCEEFDHRMKKSKRKLNESFSSRRIGTEKKPC